MGMNTGKAEEGRRLLSLDALRGADMMLIIGADALLVALAALYPGNETWGKIAWHMGHAAWRGLRIYDMIFPLFVFISGIAMGLSWQERKQQGCSRTKQAVKLWKRACILVMMGWLVNGSISWEMSSMRYASVLGLIGISGAMAGSVQLTTARPAAWGSVAIILIATVGCLQHFCGDMTPAGCINAWIDQHFLPGVLHYEVLDPEGLLCIVSATALSLSGMVCGSIIRNIRHSVWRLSILSSIGLLCIAIGATCCGPIIKQIWSAAFTTSMVGWGFLLMSIMHLLTDVFKLQKWVLPLQIVGTNALFIYLATQLLPFDALTARLFGGTIRLLVPESLTAVAHCTASMLLAWGLCYWLWRRKIFIKI